MRMAIEAAGEAQGPNSSPGQWPTWLALVLGDVGGDAIGTMVTELSTLSVPPFPLLVTYQEQGPFN